MLNPFDPMPTIKAILGMTMAQDVAESILLAQLDDFEAPQCESKHHATETNHHSGAAGFLLISPCGHDNGYRCVAFVKWILTHHRVMCGQCESRCDASELTFLPIGGQK